MTCAIINPMARNPDDDRETAHLMPSKMSTEIILDVVTTADLMQKAIYTGEPREDVERLREVARAQFEAYLDAMAAAATHVRFLKP